MKSLSNYLFFYTFKNKLAYNLHDSLPDDRISKLFLYELFLVLNEK